MAIPLATTTITVLRVAANADRDPYAAEPEPTPAATGVRAVIYSPTGEEQEAGGSRSNTYHRLACDVTDLNPATDTIKDETTLEVYDLEWAEKRVGLGQDHMTGRLQRTTGVVS